MKPRLLLATTNAHKTAEVRAMAGNAFEVMDLSEVPGLEPAEETGTTFEANALLKAVHISRHVNDLVMADDSGLEVDALGGQPGVFSARFSGPGATDASNRLKLLAALKQAGARGKARSARFRCVLAIARNGKWIGTAAGAVEGVIGTSERGSGGFGYDSVFIPEGQCKTFAELPPERKNSLSHRARALAVALPIVESALRPATGQTKRRRKSREAERPPSARAGTR